MKKFIYLFLVSCLSVLAAGCNDWLDINPRSQIKTDILYQTEEGYKKALNGVYIQMGESGLYGKNTTMFIPDALSRSWTIPTTKTDVLNGLSNYDYTVSSVESIISSTFENYYNAIAQLNDLLGNLDSPTITFKYNNDKILKGEALGLRAFLHFDILRYFGSVPSQANDADKAIPYVTEMTTDNSKLTSKTWKEVVTNIEKDLTDAENILKVYDPIVNNSVDSLKVSSYLGKNNMPEDSWQLYRQGRFNYYAVLGTKARFYHWIGDTENAVKYAKMVVDSHKFNLCNEAYFEGYKASLTMYAEHLFGIENPDLQTIVKPLFGVESPTLTQTVKNLDKAYESSTNVNDIRYTNHRYWEEKTYQNSSKSNHFYKYIGNGNIEADNRIPLLRYAEMYFILIEDLPIAEAKDYFLAYRQSRAMSSSMDETAVQNETVRLSTLEKEYRKEFFGEGQMFFFYKKHNYKTFTWPTSFTVPVGGYVIPKPKGLTNFE